jgi:hypothetical protein
MALLWIDGFEGYGETLDGVPAPTGVLDRKYASTQAAGTMLTKAGRYGGFAIYFGGNNNQLFTPAITTHDTMISGVNWYCNHVRNTSIISFYDGNAIGMEIRKQDNVSELQLFRAGVLVATTSGLGISVSTWYNVQMKVKCHDTLGEYEVKVDGVTVLSATGVDTKGSGGHDYHDICVLRAFASRAPSFDDWYVCDGSGSINNDFLGVCKVVRIDPDGDDTANWTTSTPSANHYENVSGTVTDDDTSYLEETSANTTDLFDYEDLSGYDNILGIQVCTDCKETDATSYTIKTPIESGGNQYDDSAQLIGSPNYRTRVRIEGTDPDTGSLWTESGLNAAKFGVKVG